MRVVTPLERKQSSHVVGDHSWQEAFLLDFTEAPFYAVTPTGFADAKQIADGIMAGQPVIVNLQTANRELKRRIIDFCSGVVCGLGGGMERIASNVFLIRHRTRIARRTSVDEPEHRVGLRPIE